jgi:hypothetical protein
MIVARSLSEKVGELGLLLTSIDRGARFTILFWRSMTSHHHKPSFELSMTKLRSGIS